MVITEHKFLSLSASIYSASYNDVNQDGVHVHCRVGVTVAKLDKFEVTEKRDLDIVKPVSIKLSQQDSNSTAETELNGSNSSVAVV